MIEQLAKLAYTGPLSFSNRQKEMIVAFQEFRKKWESWAQTNGYEYELCTDNNVFDGGFINRMIADYVPEYHPIPYATLPCDSKPDYCAFWETHSMQRGILFIANPSYKGNWGYSDRIKQIYEIPTEIAEKVNRYSHDHLPHHDAYSIACDLHILHAIRKGEIKLK